MNVIFLDIDGVLNNRRTPNMNHAVWRIDPQNVARLNCIIEAVDDLTIVLSSSWRYSVRSGNVDLNALLQEYGFIGDPIIERTICDDEWMEEHSEERGHEIQRWLDEHPEVERFVILDDDDDMAHLLPHLIQTSFMEGLLDEHVGETIRRLRLR